MKTKLLGFVLVTALVLAGCGGGAWKEFAPSGAGFSVSAPADLDESVQSVPTAVGDIEMHMFTLDQGQTGYAVGYFDLPAELLSLLDDPGPMLDGAVQGAFGAVGGSITNQTEIAIGGFPGREAIGSFSFEGETGTVKARVYIVNGRVFQVYVAARGTGDETPDMDKFLDSFKLK